MEPADALVDVQLRVEQHAVDNEPHEERLDHLKARADQRQSEDHTDAVPMRPEPAEILPQVLAPLSTQPCRGLFCRLQPFGRVELIVEQVLLVLAGVFLFVNEQGWVGAGSYGQPQALRYVLAQLPATGLQFLPVAALLGALLANLVAAEPRQPWQITLKPETQKRAAQLQAKVNRLLGSGDYAGAEETAAELLELRQHAGTSPTG